MTSKVQELGIFAYLPGATNAVPAGILSIIEEGGAVNGSKFVYGTRYLERLNALEIDPVSLSLKNKKAVSCVEIFPAGELKLFGGLRDAAPDAWGRRVIESKRKASANSLPESTYLLEAGTNRVGALDVRHGIKEQEPRHHATSIVRLEYLMEAAARVETGESIPVSLEDIFEAGSALGGARPKATVSDSSGKLWLAKFASRTDQMDVPSIEVATLKLAAKAGLHVPEVRTEKIGAGLNAMLIERFDRVGAGENITRRHFISALTLIGCHEQDSPSKSYADIAEAIRKHGAASSIANDLKELFGRMIFNILVSNDDDHLRNHGALWSSQGDSQSNGWVLSPLYDVVPRPSSAFERRLHLGVGSQGKSATLINAMSEYGRFGLTKDVALTIIERIWLVVREWKTHFEECNISAVEINKVQSAFRHVRDLGGKEFGIV